MLAEGSVFPFVILIIIVISIAVTIGISKKGHIFEMRTLPAIDSLEEAVGRAVEMGGPVHWCYGTGRGYSLKDTAGTTVASFQILKRLAYLCATRGAKLLPTTGQPEAISIIDGICGEEYTAAGVSTKWSSENIAFFPDKAYKIGVPARLSQEQVKANIMIGHFVSETIIIAETGANIGAFQIGGTTAWNNIAYFVTSCDYFLIGEEIYAAGAYLSKDPIERGSLIGQDISKIVFAVVIVIGIISLTLGSDLLIKLLNR